MTEPLNWEQTSDCLRCFENDSWCDGKNPLCEKCAVSQDASNHRANKTKAASRRRVSTNSAYLPKSGASLNNDKRRRKYHTDYIDSLERKASKLESFIRQFSKDDEALKYINEKMDGLKYEGYSEFNTADYDGPSDAENLVFDLNEIHIGEQKDKDVTDPFRTQLQEEVNKSAYLTGINQSSLPVSIIGNTLFIRDITYQPNILRLFKQNFAVYSPGLMSLVSTLETMDYNSVYEPPTLKLLFNVVLGFGNVYSASIYKEQYATYFITRAKDSLMDIVCKSKSDIYLVTACFLLSCYEMAQNHFSEAYIYNGIACSLSQHMGLHISYNSKMGQYGPKQTPFNLAMLWTICQNDRLVTTYLEVPSVIHYKRIIAPFYQLVTPSDHPLHLAELCFSYATRLFYIFDRFSDQILTVNYDIGDTDNKPKLLRMALKTLEELRNTLPDGLQLAKLDGKSPDDLFILTFHIKYYVVILRLNKTFMTKDNYSAVIRNSTLKATIAVCDLFIQLNREDLIDRAPSYTPSMIHFVTLFLVIFIANGTESSATLNRLRSYFFSLREVLLRTRASWREASDEFISNLDRLRHKHGIISGSMANSSGDPTPARYDENAQDADAVESFPELDRFFQKWEQNFPQMNATDYKNDLDEFQANLNLDSNYTQQFFPTESQL